MKRCPRCEKTYADTETFCEDDGTALVSAGPAFAESAAASGAEGEGQVECPVCGGKAQPGELICNFCGARLAVEPQSQPEASAPPRRISTGPAAQPPRTVSMPPREASRSGQFTGRMADSEDDDEGSGAGILGTLGYVAAAIIALGGGAWLALHLSSRNAAAPVAVASPAASASAVPSGPSVALANAMGVQVRGESAAAPERNQEAARKFFEDRKGSLLDSYNHALAGDSSLRDAMVVRLRILPSGTVDAASVRASTNPNPGLDAEIVRDVMAWNFPAFSGSQVEVDYPIIFTNDPSTKDALESQLSSKIAAMSPTEEAEYASSPAPATPAPAAAASAAPAETPAAAAVEPAPAPAPVVRRRAPRREPPPTPTLTLQQQVKLALNANPKLRRTDCYTSGSTVTVFGKVFDANDKALAERVVSRVPGVGNVIDSLTTDEADWAARQAKIAQQLYNAGLNNVTIKVIGHDAYLGGSVKSEAQKQQAVTIAESAAPVQVRTNLITVELGNMFGF
ncbi:MAG TPA: AgmX/PglI C-terminal domain-containing protein [Candidatus Acidoferrales bacterium]|nr:AgmX/PglI C-terminal domain-containing protein [Candidatus Acidoferrales bacterium]